MEHYEMTNLQRIEKILLAINGRKFDQKSTQSVQKRTAGLLTGRIGADVTYRGNWVGAVDRPAGNPYKYASEDVKLMLNGQEFASISVKNDVTHIAQKRNQVKSTIVQVFSPHYRNGGCVTKTIEAVNQLHVFHAPNETPDQVINQICDLVAYSKAKDAYDKKFSELNIATRLADASREL